MNRCNSNLPNLPNLANLANLAKRLRLALPLALLATLTLGNGSQAVQPASRPFPPNALRGVLTVTQAPEVLMNGKADRLSPGARIRGANNMLVLSASLAGQAMVVHYTREPTGSIHEVWVLTAAEAALPPPGQR